MRTLTTSKGKTYENVNYAWAPLHDGSCGISLEDSRPLHEIAAEFDGLTHMHYADTATGEYDFDGYTRLTAIRKQQDGRVFIRLVKGAA